jgi:hypothetical protein
MYNTSTAPVLGIFWGAVGNSFHLLLRRWRSVAAYLVFASLPFYKPQQKPTDSILRAFAFLGCVYTTHT